MEWQPTQLLHDDRDVLDVYSRKRLIQDHDRPHIVYIAVAYYKSFFNDIFDSAPSTFAHTSRLFLSGSHVFNSIQKTEPYLSQDSVSLAIIRYRVLSYKIGSLERLFLRQSICFLTERNTPDQKGHISGQRAHALQAFRILCGFAGFPAMDTIPILA